MSVCVCPTGEFLAGVPLSGWLRLEGLALGYAAASPVATRCQAEPFVFPLCAPLASRVSVSPEAEPLHLERPVLTAGTMATAEAALTSVFTVNCVIKGE